jgi:hypothetical protein
LRSFGNPRNGSGLELPDLNQSRAHVICCFAVVALEDVLRFMTRNFHSCATIDARFDEIKGRTAAKVASSFFMISPGRTTSL